MMESGTASIPQSKKDHYSKRFTPTLSPFTPYFFKRLKRLVLSAFCVHPRQNLKTLGFSWKPGEVFGKTAGQAGRLALEKKR
jgi:hypothetical protein